MTVASTTSKASYTGDGLTATFVVPFYFLADTDLLVVTKSAGGAVTTLTVAVDYSVTGSGNPAGGSITLVNGALIAGTTITIARNAALTQLVDYQANDPFPAETHEKALDRLTMIAQQLYEGFQRALRVPITTTTINGEIPTPIAGRALKWSQDGTYLINSSIDPDELYTTSLSNSNSAAVSAANAALSAASAQTVATNFNALYLGAKTIDPTVDNVGAALQTGAFYYNSVTGKTRVYSGSSWADAATSAPVSFTTNVYSGDGTTTVYTLSTTPATTGSVIVAISGVIQRITTDYTLSGTTLTFTTAPPTGTTNIYVIVANNVSIGTPDNGSVSTIKIQDSAVTTPKIADAAVTTAKVADANITPAKLSAAFGGWVTAATAALARTALGLTSAAITAVGTAANNLVQLDGTGKLPAVDGSQLTGLASGGVTLLGTLNTTSGSTQTLSGLTLTSYKMLFISLNNVSETGLFDISIYGSAGISGQVSVTSNLSSAASNAFWGTIEIDLSNGAFSSNIAMNGGTTGTTSYMGSPKGGAGKTNINSASTSISFILGSGTFDSGTITIYGVK